MIIAEYSWEMENLKEENYTKINVWGCGDHLRCVRVIKEAKIFVVH